MSDLQQVGIFTELGGGRIIGANGLDAVRVCVENLTTDEAKRITTAILHALDREFTAPATFGSIRDFND